MALNTGRRAAQPPIARRNHRSGGFALVISIALMAFVVMLILSLSVLVNVETAASTINQAQNEAHRNALHGLQIAIAELQKHAGPDQRVTAPATTVFPQKNTTDASGELFDFYRSHAEAPGRTYLTPTQREVFENDIRDWWQGKHPRWTAVIDSSLRQDAALSSTQYGEFDRSQGVRWLVSGNEGKDPSDPDYLTPDDPNNLLNGTPETNDALVWLVGEGSATTAADSVDGLDGRVMALKQAISETGSYAYWVGDESTKANFAALDPYADESYGSNEYWNRLLVPQRLGWENIDGFTSLQGSDFNNPANPLYAIVARLINRNDIAYLDPVNLADDPINRGPVPRNFHSITAYSRSVLSDTSLGGLKKDLTQFLTAPGGSTLSINDPILDPALYSEDDPRFGGVSGFPNSTQNIPQWGKVLDWYQNTGDASDAAEVTPPTPTRSGVHPVITMFKSHMGLSIDPATNRLNLRYYPVVTLWNPFDAKIETTTYDLELGVPLNFDDLRVNYQLSAAPANPADPYLISGSANWAMAKLSLMLGASGGTIKSDDSRARWDLENYLRPLRATITTDMEPGELLVFSLDQDTTYNGTSSSPVQLANLHEDLVSLASQNVAPFGIVIPSPFLVEFTAAPTSFPLTVSPSPIQDLRYRGIVWNNSFHSNELLSLHSQAVDTRDFPRGTPYATLLLNGNILFRNAAGSYNQNNTTEFVTGELRSGNPAYDTANLPLWRKLYTDSQFTNRAPLSSPSAGGRWDKDDTIIGLADYAQFIGLFPRNANDLNINRGENAELFHRFFSTFNPSASLWELNPAVDLARSNFGQNNGDGFDQATIGYSLINYVSPSVAWGANLSTTNTTSGRTQGFFFTETIRSTSSPFIETTHYPIKNIRRPDAELVSIGQLSQVNLTELFYQPSKAVATSNASIYVDRGAVSGITQHEIYTGGINGGGSFTTVPNNADNQLLDLSYLLNESLWDRYFFSTIPNGSFDPQTDTLDNARHVFDLNKLTDIDDARDFDRAAEFLYNVGALNVNTTSVEAWKALLTAFRDLELRSSDGGSNPSETVPVVSSLRPIEDPVEFTEASGTTTPSTYGAAGSTNRDITRVLGGFRFLTDDMIQTLSERIVDEVRLRGPFYSVADFVNRQLVAPDRSTNAWETARTQATAVAGSGSIDSRYDPLVGLIGITGALQRAIDLSGINGGVNYPSDVSSAQDRVFNLEESASSRPAIKLSSARYYTDTEHAAGAPAGENGHLLAGTPGFVSQADLLAMIGPALTARGDTFIIRSYGESKNPLTGEVEGEAWLEAVVQRTADYIDGNIPADTAPSDLPASADSSRFGRRFEIISIRFLSSDEI